MTASYPAASGPPRLRASDAEREQIAQILRTAMTEGRLTLEEGEERLGAVYAARFRDELGPLTTDLPDGGRRSPAESPQDRAADRSYLSRHATVVVLIAAILTGAWALSGAQFFWPVIPLIFLSIGLARHARYGRRWPHHHWQHHQVAPWNMPDRR
jgi:Domain of unknown function (DUF1707)